MPLPKVLAILTLLAAGLFAFPPGPARAQQADKRSLAAEAGPSSPLAAALTILNIPARLTACAMSGALGSTVMMASGGARYDLSAEMIGEGCSGPWIISRRMVYENLLEKEKPAPLITVDDMVLPSARPQPLSSLEEFRRGDVPSARPSSKIGETTLTPGQPETTSSLEEFRRGDPSSRPSTLLEEIYFDFDSYDLRADARDTLTQNAAWLRANPSAQRIDIEGHADERGTSEYNVALGAKRAQAAKDYLVSLGIAAERLLAISYGKELPVCREPTEECWQRNRRVRFVIILPAPLS